MPKLIPRAWPGATLALACLALVSCTFLLTSVARAAMPPERAALVEIAQIPAGRTPLQLGDKDAIAIGLDVYAIGHPDGQSWSYTKGIISQYRINYDWDCTGENLLHRGNIIQTQTPINPGNSGGPLLDDGGRIVGVNSFGGGGEGLNFAVAVDEIEAFLAPPDNRTAERLPSAEDDCASRLMSEEISPQSDAQLEGYDTDCDGVIDAVLRIPDDAGEPLELALDRDGDNQVDGWIYDNDQDGEWDISFWDDNFNGEPELVGHHVDGSSTPTEFESYIAWEKRVAAVN
jgi:hypothetical protein